MEGVCTRSAASFFDLLCGSDRRRRSLGGHAKAHFSMSNSSGAHEAAGSSKPQNGSINGKAVTLSKELPCSVSLRVDSKSVNKAIAVIAAAVHAVETVKAEKQRSLISTAEDLRRGRLVENDTVYQQSFVVRSYEVGFDKIASIETIANLFQETALNHVGMSDFVGDGMGTTHAMMKNKLIWVITRMHVDVTKYPAWGDQVQIDSWVGASGRNGMRRDFLVRDYSTGELLARSTSNWAMMNQETRKLSKMPDEVRAEISPYFINRSVMPDEFDERIRKVDEDSAPYYIKEGLVPKLHDMDMNQHVNHVKYIGWLLESVPQALLRAYEIGSMRLEYRRECSPMSVVASLARPQCCHGSCNLEDEATTTATSGPLHYTHLLRMQEDGTEILRAKTEWRLKERKWRRNSLT